MNHDSFVAAAYVVTALGTLVMIVHSWVSMRKSEALADDLKGRK